MSSRLQMVGFTLFLRLKIFLLYINTTFSFSTHQFTLKLIIFSEFTLVSEQVGFPAGSMVKNSPAMQEESQEMQVQSLSWEDSLEEGMATHSSILAGRIPWTEEPGWLQSIGLQRVRHDWSDLACMHASEQVLRLAVCFSLPLSPTPSLTLLFSPLTAGASGAERWALEAAGHPSSLPWVCSLSTSRTSCPCPPLYCELCAGAASPSLEEAVGFCCN